MYLIHHLSLEAKNLLGVCVEPFFLFLLIKYLLYIYFLTGDQLKPKEIVETDVGKTSDVKDELIMEVPVIDLKSMNKETDGKILVEVIYFVCEGTQLY